MILDSSAVVAVLRDEPGYEVIEAKLDTAREPIRIAAPTLFETSIVVDSARDPATSRALDDFIALFDVEVVPFTRALAESARAAHRDFGKGSGHPAKLNFGDCMAYAVARAMGEPLLFKGNDFTHTDVEPA